MERWKYPKEVFDALDSSRRAGFNGPTGIPISEFDVYAKGYGFSRREWQEVWEDVQTIDNVWLSEIAKKRAKETKGH